MLVNAAEFVWDNNMDLVNIQLEVMLLHLVANAVRDLGIQVETI